MENYAKDGCRKCHNHTNYDISGEIMNYGSINTENNIEQSGVSREPDIQTGAVKIVTQESKPFLPEYYEIGDKYLDLILKNPQNTQVLVNLSALQDIYEAGEGISIEDMTITNTKTTEWGEIAGTLSDQTDLTSALASKCNADLSNMPAIFWEKLKVLIAQKTGEVCTEAEILAWITEMAYSTFDSDKFTVVGTPIVTTDGIASGFSNSNYLTIPASYLQGATNYSVKMRFKFTNPEGVEYFFAQGTGASTGFSIYKDANNKIYCRIGSSATVNNFYSNVNLNDEFSLNIQINNGVGTLYWSLNGVAQTPYQLNMSAYSAFNNDTIYIGTRSSQNSYTRCSIDLKQFSITVDGVEVFSGNKTGIDIIKPDDYTVVGTPTISADGVASGFSSSNYLTISTGVTLSKNTYFKIYTRFKTPATFTKNGRFFGRSTNLNFGHTSAGKISGTFLGAGLPTSSLEALSTDTVYDAILIYDSTGFYVKYKAEAESTYTSTTPVEVTSDSTVELAGDIGNQANDSTAYFTGSIDLNGFKVYVDGDLVYQPCLKIPYTESKTGSKIVNSIYRDRVNDMAEQFGFAPYYTLSDTDFTLPMGEVYGFLGKLQKISENEIGLPVPTLTNTLQENEIWLEGAEVSKTTYAKLYSIYGDDYGTPVNSGNFVLPDFRGRVMQGIGSSGTWGYIEAGLPNITGTFYGAGESSGNATGAFYRDGSGVSVYNDGDADNKYGFDASLSSSVYSDSVTTVQPPAIKVRVKTRYE